MKKISGLRCALLGMLSVVFLGACGNQTKQATSSKQQDTTIASIVKKAAKSASKSNKSSSIGSKKAGILDFDQIKAGNYSSLQGSWQEISHGANHLAGRTPGIHFEAGGTDHLSISKKKVIASGVTFAGDKLIDTANDVQSNLKFKEEDHALFALLVDPSIAINWSISFYPKGTTTKYNIGGKSSKNKQNLIVIWTSNNQYTQVFAQESTNETGLNIAEISDNDFSSMEGTWENPTNGKTIIVTNVLEHTPKGSRLTPMTGVVIKGTRNVGTSGVITSGKVGDGSITGSIGTFSLADQGSPLAPLAILPKGYEYEFYGEKSDPSRDRLIPGAGQGGIKSESFFRVK